MGERSVAHKMKLSYKQLIGGILVLVMMTTGGTVYVKDLGTKTGCRAGFEYVDSGEFEGQFRCVTQSSTRYETCFEVYNSSNTENYWCRKGVLIDVEEPQVIKKPRGSGSGEVCDSKACYQV